jgi:hypothetical protein
MFSKKLAALAALSMITASSAAVAQSAAPQTVSAVPAGESTQGSNELVGTTAWILAAVALGLIVWGIIELTGDSDSP